MFVYKASRSLLGRRLPFLLCFALQSVILIFVLTCKENRTSVCPWLARPAFYKKGVIMQRKIIFLIGFMSFMGIASAAKNLENFNTQWASMREGYLKSHVVVHCNSMTLTESHSELGKYWKSFKSAFGSALPTGEVDTGFNVYLSSATADYTEHIGLFVPSGAKLTSAAAHLINTILVSSSKKPALWRVRGYMSPSKVIALEVCEAL